jgi:hypothetical protein
MIFNMFKMKIEFVYLRIQEEAKEPCSISISTGFAWNSCSKLDRLDCGLNCINRVNQEISAREGMQIINDLHSIGEPGTGALAGSIARRNTSKSMPSICSSKY